MELIFIISLLLIAVIYKIISVYNQAKTLLVMRDEAAANIALCRTKRLNLIEQLLRLVKSYKFHEKGLLENISSSFGRDGAEKAAPSLVSRIAALHMHFPEIKAQELFAQTLVSLEDVESQLQKSRERVNKISRSYNAMIVVFPNNLISSLFRFEPVFYLDESSIGIMEDELRVLAEG